MLWQSRPLQVTVWLYPAYWQDETKILPPLKPCALASPPMEEGHFSNFSTWRGIFVLYLSKKGTLIYFSPSLHNALITKGNSSEDRGAWAKLASFLEGDIN